MQMVAIYYFPKHDIKCIPGYRSGDWLTYIIKVSFGTINWPTMLLTATLWA